MNFIEMWEQMGPMAKAIGVVLVIMSMISFGVAIERIYTFTQARKQSKLYAPQVAKHLKEGRLKDAIAISSRRTTATATSPRSCSPGCRNISSSRKPAAT